MELVMCEGCRRPFNYLAGEKLCPACMKAEEQLFQQVKEYLNENPGASIPAVCEATGAKKSKIQKWILQERLILGPNSPITMVCENCGARIYTGKLCDSCKKELRGDLQTLNNVNKMKIRKKEEEAALAMEVRRKGKMNFLKE